MRKVFFVLLIILGFAAHSQMKEIEVPQTFGANINQDAVYLLSFDYNLDKAKIRAENFRSYTDFTKQYPTIDDFPENSKSIWIRFILKNTSTKTQKFNIQVRAPYLQLYDITYNQTKLVSVFGAFNKMVNYPLPNDPFTVPFSLKPKESKEFLLQTRQSNYSIFIPGLRIIDNEMRALENADKRVSIPTAYMDFTFVVLGYLFLFLLFCIYQLALSKEKKSFIFLIILDLIYILYFGTSYNIFRIELDFIPRFAATETASYIGILFPPAHFLFILSLVKFQKNSRFEKLLYLSCLFYILVFIEEYSDFQSPLLCKAFQFINTYAILYSVIILSILYLYLLRFKGFFYRAINFGLFLNLLASVFFMINTLNIKYNFNSTFISENFFNICLFHEGAVCADFAIFLFALLHRDKWQETQLFFSKQKVEHENHYLKTEHDQTKKDLQNLKNLIEKESIILKNKSLINLNELVAIKADDHYLNIFTKDGRNHLVRGKLADIILELPTNFVKCHRSFIINRNFVKHEQAKFLVMKDNTEIPISRGFRL